MYEHIQCHGRTIQRLTNLRSSDEFRILYYYIKFLYKIMTTHGAWKARADTLGRRGAKWAYPALSGSCPLLASLIKGRRS